MEIPEELSKLYPEAKAVCDEAVNSYPGHDVEALEPFGIPASLEAIYWLGFMEGDKQKRILKEKIVKVLSE